MVEIYLWGVVAKQGEVRQVLELRGDFKGSSLPKMENYSYIDLTVHCCPVYQKET